jgi:hypothetical protein
MMTKLIKSGLLLALLLLAVAISPATVAAQRAQRANFDGAWSVLVVTDSGTCDRAYRYGVQIVNGRVTYSGEAGINISGQVEPNGRVNVVVRRGDQEARGSGRLSRDSGSGQWSGRSPGQECAGHWEAERRG